MEIKVKLQSTSMTVDEYMSEANDAKIFLQDKLDRLFGGEYTTNVGIKKIIGPCFVVDIYNVKPGSKQLDYLNATACIRLMLHLTNDFGRQTNMDKFELELIQMSYQLKNAGLKYRKITGKSPMDMSKKLVAWLIKNEQIIKSLGVR